MKYRCHFLALTALLCGARFAAAAPLTLGVKTEENPDAAATVIVCNENDPESLLLANFYAEKRGIPKDQIVGLKCSTAEEITRAEYDSKIAEPLRQAFTSNFWWKLRPTEDPFGPVESTRIRYVVLMRGVPLKISHEAVYPGDKPYNTSPIGQHNEASVESEVSVLSLRSTRISGAVNNPYYRSFKSIRESRQHEIMLATRLDGPSAAVVRRMIVDAIETEREGLRGFAYIDARGITETGLKEGDTWMENAANFLQRNGLPVILDKGPGLFPDGYPMRNVAIYLGWYSEQPAGPFAGMGIRFRPGAVACHIHSFSALTVRHPQARWVGPLLQQGAAAVIGNVYEPYLSLTPNLDVFIDRLKSGFTFAEAGYMSERVLSWMTTLCGDPLYRPFPVLPPPGSKPDDPEWEAYRDGAQKWFSKRPEGEAELKAAAEKLNSGIVWEGLGLLQIRANDVAAGITSFENARKTYQNEEDIMRATIHQLIQLRAAKKDDEAVALAKAETAAHPSSPALNVVRMVVPAAFPGGVIPPLPPPAKTKAKPKGAK